MGIFQVTRTRTRGYPYPPTHGSALPGSVGVRGYGTVRIWRGALGARSGHVMYYLILNHSAQTPRLA